MSITVYQYRLDIESISSAQAFSHFGMLYKAQSGKRRSDFFPNRTENLYGFQNDSSEENKIINNVKQYVEDVIQATF